MRKPSRTALDSVMAELIEAVQKPDGRVDWEEVISYGMMKALVGHLSPA